MEQEKNNPRFPEGSGPSKYHGEQDRERYLREGGKIEDYPEDPVEPVGLRPGAGPADLEDDDDSSHLTDISGEEKKEDYINTDERKRDLNSRGLTGRE